jgi:DNA modification methylase
MTQLEPRAEKLHRRPTSPAGTHTLAPIDSLKPYPRNARTHSRKQIGQIADSIDEFGFTNPVLIDENAQIIAGHGRVEAARLLGMSEVPTLRIDHLTEVQKRAYILADNKIAENAGWNPEILSIELEGLIALNPEFDIEITGYETPEIDILIGDTAESVGDDDNVPKAELHKPAISRPEDLWRIGDHKLYCGDALRSEAYDCLLGDQKAQMVFADPPYNVPIDGHVSGLGRVRHREFAMATGEMTGEQFTAFLVTAFRNLAKHSVDGAIQYICIDWRHIGEVIAAGNEAYSELKNLCVWAKTNGGMGSLYRSQHELVFVFKSGTATHINNVELGRHGRNRTNLWTYAGINSFGKNRDAELAMHPTVKPVALVADAILDCSKRGGIVLDAFAGSGTTLIAAGKTGRRGYGIELDPHYCDVIIRRMAAAGLEASHAETGLAFSEIGRQRAAEADSDSATPPGDGCIEEAV